MDSTPLRDVIVTDTPTTRPAVERVVETTVPPTTTTTPPTPTRPDLTAEQVHLIIANNDPPGWSFTVDEVTQGNIDLFSDVCATFATMTPDIIKPAFAAWFAQHLTALGV